MGMRSPRIEVSAWKSLTSIVVAGEFRIFFTPAPTHPNPPLLDNAAGIPGHYGEPLAKRQAQTRLISLGVRCFEVGVTRDGESTMP